MLRGMVRSIRGNHFRVQAEGAEYRCSFRGRAKRERKGTRKPAAVGDWVEFEPLPDEEGAIEKVLPRRNRLSRPDPFRRSVEQVMVANVDALLAVHSSAQPRFNSLCLDKCLVMGLSCGIESAVLVTKIDLDEGPDLSGFSGGHEVFRVSSVTGEGVGDVRTFLEGKTTVLLGPSGVGKSSLLNALDPSLGLKIGKVSGKTGEGRHTTTWVEILDVGPARVVDTPGLEFFDFWNLTEDRLPAFFFEFADRGCRFRDCRHDREPECAVRKAVEEGTVPRSRHESYLEIRRLLMERGPAFTPTRPPRKRKK